MKEAMIVSLLIYFGVALTLTSVVEGSKKQNLWIANIKGGEEVARGVALDVGLTYQDKGVSLSLELRC